MARIKTPHVTISGNVGVGASIARGAIAAGRRAEMPALTKEQMSSMTPQQIKAYNLKRSRVNLRVMRKTQKHARKAAKPEQSLELQKHQMLHNTIRQGLAELGGMGAEAVGTAAITRGSEASNAVSQNVSGGMVAQPDDGDDYRPEDGPVAYSKRRRAED